MYIKVFFDDKPVYLCDEITKEINEVLHHPDAVFVDELSPQAIKSLLHEIKKDDFHAGVLWNDDLEKLEKAFYKQFVLQEAAGGIVQNEEKQLLFIFRRGKWDLPKGKMEKGEKPEDCAIREVEEETGVTPLLLKKKIGETRHVYNEFGKQILKITHWYYMQHKGTASLQPQTEEDITEVKWIDTKNIKEPAGNTYKSIQEILKIFFDEP